MEQQHRDRIGQPMLLALFVDAADPVQPGLDRPQHRREECALAIENRVMYQPSGLTSATTIAQYNRI